MPHHRPFDQVKQESNSNSNGSSAENSDAWVHVHTSGAKESHNNNNSFGSLLLASGMVPSSNNSSSEWPGLTDPLPYNVGWWNSSHLPSTQSHVHFSSQAEQQAYSHNIELPETLYTQLNTFPIQNTSDSSPSTGNDHDTNIARPKQKKRRRPTSVHFDGHTSHTGHDRFFVPTGEALSRAKNELSTCSWSDMDLQFITDFPCDQSHAFAMCPMGPEPKDFYGSPLRMGSFQARVIEPFSGAQRRAWTELPAQDSIVYRPPSKNLYLLFTVFPILGSHSSLEEGFALLTICRRRGVRSRWQPHSFVAFEDPNMKKKVMGNNIGFVANLDRCKETHTGRRVWGERTSHVNNAQADGKPVRIEPKGSARNYNPEDQFCIMISLHAPSGRLLNDLLGEMCIARTNPFQYQEKKVDPSLQHLLLALDKLTVSQRTALADSAYDRDMMQLLLTDANSTKEAAGLFSSALVDSLPDTTVPLNFFYPPANLQVSPNSLDIKKRLRSIARLMGEVHANPDLISKHSAYLKSGNVVAATGRFNQLADSNMADHRKWLSSEGVQLNPQDVFDRAQNLGSLMADRKYKSKFVVCVGNIYPDSVLVDRFDEMKVYCLAEDGRESPLEIMDHVYPLARLAFTSKTAREEIESVLIAPYMATYSAHWQEEKIFPYERFWLHLHAIHLDYFLYWTKFRNAHACRRIQERLLEEDDYFDPSFFGPADFKRFELRY